MLGGVKRSQKRSNRAATESSRPGLDRARASLTSSRVPARQYSGTIHEARAPTVTGQFTSAVVKPLAAAASQSAGTLMSSAYQRQPSLFFSNGSQAWLDTTPWMEGSTPVAMLV